MVHLPEFESKRWLASAPNSGCHLASFPNLRIFFRRNSGYRVPTANVLTPERSFCCSFAWPRHELHSAPHRIGLSHLAVTSCITQHGPHAAALLSSGHDRGDFEWSQWSLLHKPCIHSWTHLKWFKPPAWDELSFASGVPTAQPGEGSGSQRAPSGLDWALRFGAS